MTENAKSSRDSVSSNSSHQHDGDSSDFSCITMEAVDGRDGEPQPQVQPPAAKSHGGSLTESQNASSSAQVSFPSVQDCYPQGAHIVCKYVVPDSLNDTKAWIGLFRVGWKSFSDNVTRKFCPGDCNGEVMFPASELPKDDEEYYQFCYFSGSGSTRGVSTPFRFKSNDEFQSEYIAVEDDDIDMMVVESARSRLNNELTKAKMELTVYQRKHVEMSKLLDRADGVISSLSKENAEHERDAELLRQSNQELIVVQQTMTADISRANQERNEISKRLEENEAYIARLRDDEKRLREDCSGVKKQSETTEVQLKELSAELEVLRRRHSDMEEERNLFKSQFSSSEEAALQLTDVTQQLKSELSDSEARRVELEKMTHELTALIKRLESELTQLQEVNVIDKDHISDLTVRLNNAEAQVIDLRQEAAAMTGSRATIILKCEELREKLANAEDKLKAAEEVKRVLNQDAEAQQECFASVQRDREEARSEVMQLRGRVRELEKQREATPLQQAAPPSPPTEAELDDEVKRKSSADDSERVARIQERMDAISGELCTTKNELRLAEKREATAIEGFNAQRDESNNIILGLNIRVSDAERIVREHSEVCAATINSLNDEVASLKSAAALASPPPPAAGVSPAAQRQPQYPRLEMSAVVKSECEPEPQCIERSEEGADDGEGEEEEGPTFAARFALSHMTARLNKTEARNRELEQEIKKLKLNTVSKTKQIEMLTTQNESLVAQLDRCAQDYKQKYVECQKATKKLGKGSGHKVVKEHRHKHHHISEAWTNAPVKCAITQEMRLGGLFHRMATAAHAQRSASGHGGPCPPPPPPPPPPPYAYTGPEVVETVPAHTSVKQRTKDGVTKHHRHCKKGMKHQGRGHPGAAAPEFQYATAVEPCSLERRLRALEVQNRSELPDTAENILRVMQQRQSGEADDEFEVIAMGGNATSSIPRISSVASSSTDKHTDAADDDDAPLATGGGGESVLLPTTEISLPESKRVSEPYKQRYNDDVPTLRPRFGGVLSVDDPAKSSVDEERENKESEPMKPLPPPLQPRILPSAKIATLKNVVMNAFENVAPGLEAQVPNAQDPPAMPTAAEWLATARTLASAIGPEAFTVLEYSDEENQPSLCSLPDEKQGDDDVKPDGKCRSGDAVDFRVEDCAEEEHFEDARESHPEPPRTEPSAPVYPCADPNPVSSPRALTQPPHAAVIEMDISRDRAGHLSAALTSVRFENENSSEGATPADVAIQECPLCGVHRSQIKVPMEQHVHNHFDDTPATVTEATKPAKEKSSSLVRTCPICGERFEASVEDLDFQRHVNQHLDS